MIFPRRGRMMTAVLSFAMLSGTASAGWVLDPAITTLSAPDIKSAYPQIGIDKKGDATVAWIADSRYVQSTRYSGGYWGSITNISGVYKEIYNTRLLIDKEGAATVMWRALWGPNSIYSNNFSTTFKDGSWSNIHQLDSGLPRSIMGSFVGPSGQITSIWWSYDDDIGVCTYSHKYGDIWTPHILLQSDYSKICNDPIGVFTGAGVLVLLPMYVGTPQDPAYSLLIAPNGAITKIRSPDAIEYGEMALTDSSKVFAAVSQVRDEYTNDLVVIELINNEWVERARVPGMNRKLIFPEITFDAQGRILMVWESCNNYYVCNNRSAIIADGALKEIAPPSESGYVVDLIPHPNGGAVALAEKLTSSGSVITLYWYVNGSWKDSLDIANSPNEMHAKIASDRSGNIIVVWEDGEKKSIKFRRVYFSPDNNPNPPSDPSDPSDPTKPFVKAQTASYEAFVKKRLPITWRLNMVAKKMPVRVKFSQNGGNYKVIKSTKANASGTGQFIWKPSKKHETENGSILVCAKPTKRDAEVCSSPLPVRVSP